jgi:hypothetical protein
MPGLFASCVCEDTLLLASLFMPDGLVPKDYIAATVSLRKQCRSIKGTAGRRSHHIIEERKCDEEIDSKVEYLS